jgi:hypothetical protein
MARVREPQKPFGLVVRIGNGAYDTEVDHVEMGSEGNGTPLGLTTDIEDREGAFAIIGLRSLYRLTAFSNARLCTTFLYFVEYVSESTVHCKVVRLIMRRDHRKRLVPENSTVIAPTPRRAQTTKIERPVGVVGA